MGRAVAEKRKIDQDVIDAEYHAVLGEGRLHGRESDIVRLFVLVTKGEQQEDRIPMSALDTIICEMSFKYGRADIVVFHVDGSASVIEVKDGTRGYNHVVAGLGQAGLYAAQLAMSRSTITKVRKCLLWTSTGDAACDALIEVMCEQAGAVPLPWGDLSTHLAYHQAVKRAYAKEPA
jgi:hypothetical protein